MKVLRKPKQAQACRRKSRSSASKRSPHVQSLPHLKGNGRWRYIEFMHKLGTGMVNHANAKYKEKYLRVPIVHAPLQYIFSVCGSVCRGQNTFELFPKASKMLCILRRTWNGPFAINLWSLLCRNGRFSEQSVSEGTISYSLDLKLFEMFWKEEEIFTRTVE